jgi:baseplate J-like protein
MNGTGVPDSWIGPAPTLAGCAGDAGCACGDCAGCPDDRCDEDAAGELAIRPSRPGLAQLPYRVGHRAAFLAAAIRRLPRVTVQDPEAGDDAPARPLRALTTRRPDDFTLALLDGWACTADVLSFYSERIINEGYLRCATERRSVVELGRLLGYRPRPGVSATAWLSYGIEDGAEVTIAAGSAVQSTPAPGSVPQTFETAEDLDARGEWNRLPLQRTRAPDVDDLAPIRDGETVDLVVAGTPVLTPGDMVLADAGGTHAPLRLLAVAPGPDGVGTLLTLGSWDPDPTGAGATLPARLGAALDRAADLTAAAVDPDRVTAQTVVAALNELKGLIATAPPPHVLRGHLVGETLPLIREQLRRDRLRSHAGPLRRWLGKVVADLERFLPASAERAAAADGPDGATAGTIGGALADLGKPPSLPPSDPSRLARDVDDALGAGSDTVASLLASAHPELRETLYQAWAQVPGGPPAALRLYALASKAGLFGATAPEQPVRDRAGTVKGTREWTLERPGTDTVAEEFRVDVTVPFDLLRNDVADDAPVTISAVVGAASGQLTATAGELRQGPLTVPLSPGDAVATLTCTPDPPTLEVALPQHDLRFTGTLPFSDDRLTWQSVGADPTTVRFETTPGDVDGGGSTVQLRIDGAHGIPGAAVPTEQRFVLRLDGPYPGIVPGSFVVVERPAGPADAPPTVLVTTVVGVSEAGFSDYGFTGRGARLELDSPWLAPDVTDESFAVVRGSVVHARSAPLELLPSPLDPAEDALCGGEIPLDRLLDGLRPGRWLIVSGERTDVLTTGTDSAGGPAQLRVPGVHAAELVMIGGVRQVVTTGPDARTRTVIDLATPLAYCYRRDTAVIYGNVLRATHGQSATQVLGSGDATVPHQRFTLAHGPLTHLASAADGTVRPALDVQVDGVRWSLADTLVDQPGTARRWQLADDGGGTASVLFGDGVEGARLPTGQENVVAVYRFGLGAAGNLDAGRLDQPTTRPQGVQTVTNPLPATGGADADGVDAIRRRVPQSVLALDRVVSVDDYAGFAAAFPGIAKAVAARVTDGQREVVHVTVAAEGDAPLDPGSDLFRALHTALLRQGDPDQPLRLARRALRTLVISAGIALEADGIWETVSAAVRATLFDRFGFAARDLAQDVVRSEVIAVVQAVPQVRYVDLDVLDALDDAAVIAALTQPAAAGLASVLGLRHRVRALQARPDPGPPPGVQPAQLVVLPADVPDVVLLKEIP